MNRTLRLLGLLPLTVALAGCSDENELTNEQAWQALQEVVPSSQAENLTAKAVELSTHFFIGRTPEKAADELKTFINSQLKCADVRVDGATLAIEYGVNPGDCMYGAIPLSGASTITIRKNETSEVVVDQVWTGLSDGLVQLDGTATATWNANDETRHVVDDVTWTHLATGRIGKGTSDRTQKPIESDFRIDGVRSWTSPRGTWHLGIDGVRASWAYPLPESGVYWLDTPFDKSVAMGFDRVGSDGAIQVTVERDQSQFNFKVPRHGVVSSN